MAARDLTASMLTAIQAGLVRPAILMEGEFVSLGVTTYLRLWTGVGNLSWDSKTWIGGGHLLGISPIAESTKTEAVGFEVTLSGMPSDKISLALSSVRKNKAGRLWLALFDSAGAVIADPYLLKSGRFDMIPIEDSGDTCTITARYEDRLIALSIPRERRYTHEDQQLRLAGDLGFEYVQGLQDAAYLLNADA